MDEFLISTTSNVEGYEIVGYHGIVTGHVVAGTNLIRDFFASVSDVLGGRSIAYKKELEAIGHEVVQEVIDKARRHGATGVVGLRVDHDELSGGGKSMLMVTASGTAVSLRQIAGSTVILPDVSILDGRALADLTRKESLIQSVSNGTFRLTQEVWELLVRNRISELAPAVLQVFKSTYAHGTAFRTGEEDLERYVEYFSIIPREGATSSLFKQLEEEIGTSCGQGLVEIIDRAGLVDFQRVGRFLKSSNQERNAVGIDLLSCTKRAYVPSDLGFLKECFDLAQENLSARAGELESASAMSGKDRRRAARVAEKTDEALKKVAKVALVIAALARAFGASGNEGV